MSEPTPQPVGDERDAVPLPLAPEAVAIDLSAAEGLPRAAQRKAWATSLLAAFTAHAALLLALALSPTQWPVGAGGIELEAIGVDIVSARVLESRRTDAAATSAPPDAVDQSTPGATPAEASSATADQKPSKSEPQSQPAGPIPDLLVPDAEQEEPTPEPAEVALAIAETRPDKPDDLEPDSEPERAEEAEPDAAPSKPSEASQSAGEGGAAARGIDDIEAPSRQSAAASPGVANEYAKTVIETLAGRKPRGTAGVRGTVRIGFTVARTGEVGEVRVLVSSGRKILDEAALAAVRSAKFPAPPSALANANLSYEVPYIFR